MVCASSPEEGGAPATTQATSGGSHYPVLCKLTHFSRSVTTTHTPTTEEQAVALQREIDRGTMWECRAPEMLEVKPGLPIDYKVVSASVFF